MLQIVYYVIKNSKTRSVKSDITCTQRHASRSWIWWQEQTTAETQPPYWVTHL